MTPTTFSLLLGFLGSCLFIASCFSINRKHILLLGMSSSIVLILGYFVKSDSTAALMVTTALTRNLLFILEPRIKHRWVTRKTIALSMVPIIITAWFFTVNPHNIQPHQLLILICPLIMVTAFTSNSITWLKIFTIANGLGWVSYEIITKAYGVIPGETIGILVAVIALWRITKTEERNPKKVSV